MDASTAGSDYRHIRQERQAQCYGPMEQREQKPNLFGLCRVELDWQTFKQGTARNLWISNVLGEKVLYADDIEDNGHTWTSL